MGKEFNRIRLACTSKMFSRVTNTHICHEQKGSLNICREDNCPRLAIKKLMAPDQQNKRKFIHLRTDCVHKVRIEEKRIINCNLYNTAKLCMYNNCPKIHKGRGDVQDDTMQQNGKCESIW